MIASPKSSDVYFAIAIGGIADIAKGPNRSKMTHRVIFRLVHDFQSCAAQMEVPMLRQFLVGGGVAIINIAIHAFVMSLVIAVA